VNRRTEEAGGRRGRDAGRLPRRREPSSVSHDVCDLGAEGKQRKGCPGDVAALKSDDDGGHLHAADPGEREVDSRVLRPEAPAK
jgi:hypothetical protein